MISGTTFATNSGSLERANKLVDATTRRLLILAHSPKAGMVRAEIDLDLRGLPVGAYIVYYREDKRWIIISRIIHGSREQEARIKLDVRRGTPLAPNSMIGYAVYGVYIKMRNSDRLVVPRSSGMCADGCEATLLQAIIRSFLGDNHVVHVALAQSGGAYAQEIGLLM